MCPPTSATSWASYNLSSARWRRAHHITPSLAGYVMQHVALAAPLFLGSGNANNYGTPKRLMGGTSVNGVAADGLGHVYFLAANGSFLYRYNVSARTVTQVDSGLIIEAGHTSTLAFDKDGNLWLGEQPAGADVPNGGRVRVYLATDLASLP